jgi:hypothetical protein
MARAKDLDAAALRILRDAAKANCRIWWERGWYHVRVSLTVGSYRCTEAELRPLLTRQLLVQQGDDVEITQNGRDLAATTAHWNLY